MINEKNSLLMVIDVQEKLLPVIDEYEKMTKRIIETIDAAKEIDIPMILTEHFPDKLGRTDPKIRDYFSEDRIYSKTIVSCCGDETIRNFAKNSDKTEFILIGIEAHICVFQTAMDLLELGKKVYIVEDATSSRDPKSKEIAFQRLRQHGAEIINFEMLIFEWVRGGQHPNFRSMIKRIK